MEKRGLFDKNRILKKKHSIGLNIVEFTFLETETQMVG